MARGWWVNRCDGQRRLSYQEHLQEEGCPLYWLDPEYRRRSIAHETKKYSSNPLYSKDVKYRRRYGISIDEFHQRLDEQDNRCPGCDTDTPGGRGWNVHHDHTTGKIIAILCHLCNRGSGLLGDDPVRLRRLADLNDG